MNIIHLLLIGFGGPKYMSNLPFAVLDLGTRFSVEVCAKPHPGLWLIPFFFLGAIVGQLILLPWLVLFSNVPLQEALLTDLSISPLFLPAYIIIAFPTGQHWATRHVPHMLSGLAIVIGMIHTDANFFLCCRGI